MNRVVLFLLFMLPCLGIVSAARADGVDVKVMGQWDFAFGWTNNTTFTKSVINDAGRRDDDHILARQRIRTQINFITSEYLQGVLMFEIGDFNWGNKEEGAALDADGINLKTKRAYLDVMIPGTEISARMGIQGLTLPSTRMGTPVLDTDVAGIVLSSPITDMFSLTGFWIRPFDAYANDGSSLSPAEHMNDEVDVFGLVLPVEGEGWTVTPWAMYGFIGANSGFYDYLFTGSYENTVDVQNSRSKAWWVGTHLELMLFDEALTFGLEGIYGSLSKADLGGFLSASGFAPNMSERVGTRGWFIAATLDYKLDWGIPGIFGWWSSGDDKNADTSGELGRLPVLSNAESCFTPTSFGMAGTFSIGADSLVSSTGVGTWGVGLQLAEVSFIEDLTHTLRVAYYAGTNDADLVRKTRNLNYLKYSMDALYLTDKDSVIEVNFDHSYQIYENLTAVVELGYLHLNADEKTWRKKSGRGWDEGEDAWKAQAMLQYTF